MRNFWDHEEHIIRLPTRLGARGHPSNSGAYQWYLVFLKVVLQVQHAAVHDGPDGAQGGQYPGN